MPWTRVGRALYALHPDHPLRVVAWKMVRSIAFESVILVMIIVNCVLLALDNPGVHSGSHLGKVCVCGSLFSLFCLKTGA